MSGPGNDTTENIRLPGPAGRGEKEHVLLIVQGRDTGTHFPLTAKPQLVGRDAEAEIRLADPQVSGRHCRVHLRGQEAEVEDLASTNGTVVDELPVAETAALPVGSTLQVGRTHLRHLFTSPADLRRDEEIYLAAMTDELTGVANRFAFSRRAEEEISFARRHRSWLALVIADADHFKAINDAHGHLAGDDALRAAGQLFLQEAREEDMVARFGGEEFVFLLRETMTDQARAFAERLRARMEAQELRVGEQTARLTFSFGVCARRGGEELSLRELLHRADEALYLAKASGRNRVAVSGAGEAAGGDTVQL
jgi:diguanylate cyclase (GGDEF)-like protein